MVQSYNIKKSVITSQINNKTNFKTQLFLKYLSKGKESDKQHSPKQ